ncbi:hypothetical protein LZC95_20305 [Pendulispora brunnea]|uniref:Uncharacterized protein n=1 Tax=Pendulispora brunnea TaxID=2905690 RepID=A0ABZ2KKF4_9BACT
MQSDEFLLDCLKRDITRLEKHDVRPGLPPFFIVPDFGIRMALGYWAPDQDARPHEHNAWTVTAVCHNELEVFTYDREEALAGRFPVKNRYPAPTGKAGYIYDPCVHNPHNPTGSWSLSVHLISPFDGTPDANGTLPIGLLPPSNAPAEPSALAACARARRRQSMYRLALEVLGRMREGETFPLVERIFANGNVGTKRLAREMASLRHGDRLRRSDLLRQDTEISGQSRARWGQQGLRRLVRSRDGRAELVVTESWGERVILRVSSWARPALEVLAREEELLVRDLPGPITDHERISIAAALEEHGFITVNDPLTLA